MKCVGIWDVAAHELRLEGKWNLEDIPAPDEWVVCFTPDGNYNELIPSLDECNVGLWCVDDGGIISIYYRRSGATVKCVFREEGRGTFLYFYDDLPHIPRDAAEIVKHHAHSRYKLVWRNFTDMPARPEQP